MSELPNTGTAGARRRSLRSKFLAAVALGAVAATGVAGLDAALPGMAMAQAVKSGAATLPTPIQGLPSFGDVVDRVKPAVVSVRVRAEVAQTGSNLQSIPDFDLPDDHPFQEFFKRFRGPEGRGFERGPSEGRQRPDRPSPRSGMAQGSGFFISADGYVVTNNHVVEKGSEVQVLMDDGRVLDAKVVGTDPKTDLALLKVTEGGPFTYVEFAPGTPRVGDWVLAVGNPFGLGGTVTAGIVSARGRDINAGPYDDFLQIDAPVNRGNSGGPTFNQSGQVVGVNTAIASPSGGNVGIAFAIPSETVQRVVSQLKDKGTVERGFLGVQIQPVTKDIAQSVGLDHQEGAIVASVQDNTPAAKAGVKSGDVVVSINGKTIHDARELSRMIAFMDPGASATLQLWRDGARKDVTITIGRQSGDKTASLDGKQGDAGVGKLGLQLAPADTVGGADRKGVAVVGVEPGSVAADKGFRTGDVIAEVAGRKVENPGEVRQAMEEARKSGKKAVLFRVEAKEGARFIAVQIPTA